jgi:hypothetical protein
VRRNNLEGIELKAGVAPVRCRDITLY